MSRAFINAFMSAPKSIFSGPTMKKSRPINRGGAIPGSVFLTEVAAIFDIPSEK